MCAFFPNKKSRMHIGLACGSKTLFILSIFLNKKKFFQNIKKEYCDVLVQMGGQVMGPAPNRRPIKTINRHRCLHLQIYTMIEMRLLTKTVQTQNHTKRPSRTHLAAHGCKLVPQWSGHYFTDGAPRVVELHVARRHQSVDPDLYTHCSLHWQMGLFQYLEILDMQIS